MKGTAGWRRGTRNHSVRRKLRRNYSFRNTDRRTYERNHWFERGRRNNSFENTDMRTLEWNCQQQLEASEVQEKPSVRGEARVPRLVIFIFCKNLLLMLTNGSLSLRFVINFVLNLDCSECQQEFAEKNLVMKSFEYSSVANAFFSNQDKFVSFFAKDFV